MNIFKNKQDQFDVLRKIQKKPKASQRELAYELGFSLGKLNYCLKALKKKGFVKLKNFQKKKNKISYLQYVITPKGISERTKLTISFMKRKMKEYDELKEELEETKKNLMIKNFQNFIRLINVTDTKKIYLIFLIFLMLISSFADILSLGLIIPYVTQILNLQKNPEDFLPIDLNFLSYFPEENFIFLLTLLLIFVFFLKFLPINCS